MSRFKTLSGRKWEADGLIDQAAGEARRRYITDVAGQQAVYLTKLQEANEYLAAFAATPATAVAGPHIAAQATRTGRSAQAVAQEVVDTASLWLGTKSPAIEAARMAAKEAVANATLATIDAILAAALAELAAI